jgi:predicted phosphate transport protein (TIGR00153 family)
MGFLNFLKQETRLLQTSRNVEGKVENFLQVVLKAGQIFQESFSAYVSTGASEDFTMRFQEIKALEHEGDDLRRDIETELYSRTLIPDLRSDVLWLVENIDKVTNLYKSNLFRLSIQRPQIPSIFHQDFIRLAQVSVQCSDALIQTTSAFFADHTAVRKGAQFVAELETHADEISTPLLRSIFDSDLDLAHKMQLMYFVERIDAIANQAEDIADQLAISAIKRRI